MSRRLKTGRFLLGVLLAAGLLSAAKGVSAEQEVELVPGDRILVLAPHPDDETLGCGGILQKAVEMGLPVRIVFLTCGDNNEMAFFFYRKRPVIVPSSVRRMGELRQQEALEAAKRLGVPRQDVTFLGYPDFGILGIWMKHWGNNPPLKGMFTRVTRVPYLNALRFGAPYKGEEILADLEAVLQDVRPTKIFVSHPADDHPDHQALYLFTRVALWDLKPAVSPVLYPYLVHYRRWPPQKGYQPGNSLGPPEALQGEVLWQVFPLTGQYTEKKFEALNAHRTQVNSDAKHLSSFIRSNEMFGDFSDIDMTAQQEKPGTQAPTLEQKESPEDLTDEEKAAFIGVEWKYAKLEGSTLVVSIRFSRPLAETVEASIHLFGYRSDVPFSQMPKIQIRLGALGYGIYDQRRKLPSGSITVVDHPKEIVVRVPLEVLGGPQKILTDARTYLGEVALDSVAWRALVISR